MKNLNGYDLTNRLKKARRKYPLTATEQALYHELVSMCNDVEWEDVFSCSNYELCSCLQITEKTLIHARMRLSQTGLIYYKSGKSKRHPGRYSFDTPLTTGIIPVNTTVNSTVNSIVDTTVDATAKTPLTTGNIPDKRERKTKLKSKEFTPPSLDDVKTYFKENGYSEDAAKKAFQYYQTGNWTDRGGVAVTNWKQKMISVWFKDENKPKAPVIPVRESNPLATLKRI